MIKNAASAFILLAVMSFWVSCGKTETNTTKTTVNNSSQTNETNSAKKNETSGGSLSSPKGSIEYQFELIKAGDYEKLKECLTSRVRDRVTKEMVEKAKADSSKYTMADLYDSEESGEFEGKKTVKVKMKNGRTLTTLVETDGKWLADTIWFN